MIVSEVFLGICFLSRSFLLMEKYHMTTDCMYLASAKFIVTQIRTEISTSNVLCAVGAALV